MNNNFVIAKLFFFQHQNFFDRSMQIIAFPKYSETNDYAKQFSLTKKERVGEAILIKRHQAFIAPL